MGASIAAINFFEVAILINHKITCDSAMKGTSAPVAPF